MAEAGTWIFGSQGPYFYLNPIFSIRLSVTRASSLRSSWELTENRSALVSCPRNSSLCFTHESHCRVRWRDTVEKFVSRLSSYHGYGSGRGFFGLGRPGDRRPRSRSLRRERCLRN